MHLEDKRWCFIFYLLQPHGNFRIIQASEHPAGFYFHNILWHSSNDGLHNADDFGIGIILPKSLVQNGFFLIHMVQVESNKGVEMIEKKLTGSRLCIVVVCISPVVNSSQQQP